MVDIHCRQVWPPAALYHYDKSFGGRTPRIACALCGRTTHATQCHLPNAATAAAAAAAASAVAVAVVVVDSQRCAASIV